MVEYQPSDDICAITQYPLFRCLFDAIQQLLSREEREEREDEDEDDEDDDSKKIYNTCELIEKLSKANEFVSTALFIRRRKRMH